MLRALGRFDDALAAYDRTVEDFPRDVVARNGRAETLRALGRFDDALAAYDRTVEDFPQNAFARNGRAETLRALERYDEALAAYDRTIEEFPHDAVARNGRAMVLLDLGSFDAARHALKFAAGNLKTVGDWVAVHILSMLELRDGATASLAANLQRYATTCPFIEQRRYFETSLAVVRISLTQIKEARRTLAELSARCEFDRDERSALRLIEAHANAADGDLAAARESIALSSHIVPHEEFRLRQLRRQIESRFGIGDRLAPTQPEDIVREDGKLARLEIGFFIDRARRRVEAIAA
jgi:tetratricopeptide (TPR) repeat protein